jgi:formylglycine-generating enzyme required for sulfatase activity
MSDRLALIIANSEFDDPKLARLATPGRDAEALAEVLSDPAIGGFDVTLLVNRTLREVRAQIGRLYWRRKKGDLLILYYSGHGIKDDYGDLYLAVKDTEAEVASATALDAAFVCDQLDKSSSQRKVVVLDCCHSGAFARGAKALGSSAGTQEAFTGSGYGRVILTASNAVEYAWEDGKPLGEAATSVFTHFVVAGLQTGAADRDGDGEISLDELYDYVYEQVITSGLSKQTPQKWAQKVEGRIIIAQNPRPVVRVAELLPELQQAIESPFAGIRQGAVSELERLLRGSDKGLALAARKALTRLADDDSRRVSAAATRALTVPPVAVPAQPSPAPPSPIVVERAEPKPEPELHPSLALRLSVKPQRVDPGGEAEWTVTLRNDGDDDLRQVTVRRERALLDKPFDLTVGKGRQFSFTTTCKTEGEKIEKVTATGIASNGESVHVEASASVQVRWARQQALEGLYREAHAKIESRAWAEAKELCQRIEALAPGYRDVGELRREADAGLRQARIREGREAKLAQAREQLRRLQHGPLPAWVWIVGGAVVGALLVGLVGQGLGWWPRAEPTEAPTEVPTAALTGIPTDVPTEVLTRAPTPTSTAEPTEEPKLSAGATWSRPADGMVMVYVPAGEFEMGSDDDDVDYALQLCNEYHGDCERGWFEDEQPVHTVALDGFWIDRTEVTNTQYQQCVESGACDPPAESGSYTRDSYYGNNAYADYPVIWVNWQQAVDYCEWAGARLPTEAEWAYAARGPEGRVFPWGDQFDGTRLNYCDANCKFDWADDAVDDGYADTAPVGSFSVGASWCSALDMAGNVWEWVADWYGHYPPGRQVNPAGPSSGENRVLRGGSWFCGPYDVRSASRVRFPPASRDYHWGFRCARGSK